MKFGELLLKDGVITRDHLKQALDRQVVMGGRIGTNLVELGIIKEDELTRLLSRFLRIEAVDPEMTRNVPEDVIGTVSKEIAIRYSAVPFKKERRRLHIAIVDVKNATMIDELKFITGYDIVPYVISEIRLQYALEKYYGVKRDLRYISVFDDLSEKEKTIGAEELSKIKASFASVRDRGEIAALIIDEARKVASRVMLLVIRGTKVEGWVSKGIDAASFSTAVEPNSTLEEVLKKRAPFRGPILNVPGNQALITLLGGTPQDCLMLPVVIRDKAVAILYADNGNTSVLKANLNYLNLLTSMAAYSFEILILRKKILEL